MIINLTVNLNSSIHDYGPNFGIDLTTLFRDPPFISCDFSLEITKDLRERVL
jgi:hypothetical protein